MSHLWTGGAASDRHHWSASSDGSNDDVIATGSQQRATCGCSSSSSSRMFVCSLPFSLLRRATACRMITRHGTAHDSLCRSLIDVSCHCRCVSVLRRPFQDRLVSASVTDLSLQLSAVTWRVFLATVQQIVTKSTTHVSGPIIRRNWASCRPSDAAYCYIFLRSVVCPAVCRLSSISLTHSSTLFRRN